MLSGWDLKSVSLLCILNPPNALRYCLFAFLHLTMNSFRRTSPAVDGCRKMALSDSGMVSQYSVKRATADRRKRLEIRSLKFSGFAGGGYRETTSGDDHCSEKIQFRDKAVGSESDLSKSEDCSYSSSSDPSSKNDVISSPISTRRDDSRSFACSSHGSISVIGRRREMEDAVRVELGFLTRDSRDYDFFGVYDGHGGSLVANACRDWLHRLLVKEIEERDAKSVDWERAMVACFEKMDEEVTADGRVGAESSILSIGSTAVVAVVGEEEVVVANCGDSRAVLSRGGVAVSMSDDHKPERPDELERIEGAGGRVINWNGHRVLGVLATSRSIGDHYLKPFVIPKPEVRVSRRTSADEFLILATDGLWDVVSNEVACQVVRRCLDGRMKRRLGVNTNGSRFSEGLNESCAAEAAAVLAELAIARGSRDNISVVVVDLDKTGKCSV